MDEGNRKEAERLALRSYSVEVRHDETTEGDSVYLATNPELIGCMGEGKTIEDAIKDLDSVRIDFIESLLDDHLTVPEPYGSVTTSSKSVVNIIDDICQDKCNEVLIMQFTS